MEFKDSLLSVFSVFYKWRKYIIGLTLATTIVASVISLFMPNYYAATTRFYAANPILNTPQYIFGDSKDASQLFGTSKDNDRVLGAGQSGTIKNFLIDSFKLVERYGIDPNDEKAMYKTSMELEDNLILQKDEREGLELIVEDTSKTFCADMANAARNRIEEMFTYQYRESNEAYLKNFAKIKEGLGSKLTLLDQKIDNSAGMSANQKEVLLDERMELATELQEVSTKIETLEQFNKDGIRSLIILEEAYPAIIKSKPKRSIIVLGAAFIAFLIAALGALVIEQYRDVDWNAVKTGELKA